MDTTGLTFKTASEPSEFEQIYELNYRTFVEEIPQHGSNDQSRLVDKFDAENTYLIALRDHRLVGMIAVRASRPFSLDLKLDDLDSYLPPANSICELRLLSVAPNERGGVVLPGLMRHLAAHCEANGYDLAVISGTIRQQKLYRHLGFVPFGPLVGAADALFQPMYLTRETALQRSGEVLERAGRDRPGALVNLLPGPVSIHPDVRRAFSAEPVSHRSQAVVTDIKRVRGLLREMTDANSVYVMMGSGTLANDAVAAQLSVLGDRGLVVSNGEFGERLIDHARRAGLTFDVLRADWGLPLDAATIEEFAQREKFGWLWAVHSETSTGVLNDLAMLRGVATRHGLRLCLDCISSIGVVPVHLAGVYLATGVSGKGLGSYTGLSIVFSDHPIAPARERLPRYLDLGLYETSDGVPFTLSSNLLRALLVALERSDVAGSVAALSCLSSWLRDALEACGIAVLAPADHSSPAVLTLRLPVGLSSLEVGTHLRENGYLLSFESRYLVERNWVQICLMGEHTREELAPLVDRLRAMIVAGSTAATAGAP